MLKYELRKIDENTTTQLIELSRMWADEGCCWGIVENSVDDLHEPLFVALDGEKIIGYLFGHYYEQEHRTSYIDAGKRCFCLDELYVMPEYRGMGIGTALYRMLEDHVKGNCSCVTLSTPAKDYRSILKLYLEELGMEFISAFLIKKMEE